MKAILIGALTAAALALAAPALADDHHDDHPAMAMHAAPRGVVHHRTHRVCKMRHGHRMCSMVAY
jgi:hypothetical protein